MPPTDQDITMITPARLPEHLEEPTLGDLLIGESCYVVPWAMRVDTDRSCFIDPSFTTHERPHGTASMQVTRAEHGLTVDLRRCAEFRWSPGDLDGVGIVGGSPRSELLPVATITGLPELD